MCLPAERPGKRQGIDNAPPRGQKATPGVDPVHGPGVAGGLGGRDVLAAEIVENLEAALAQFRSVTLELVGEGDD